MSFDEKARAMLMLGLLNDAFGDLRNIIYYLQDFVMSHPEMAEELDKLGLMEILQDARELERKILESMEKLKKIVYED